MLNVKSECKSITFFHDDFNFITFAFFTNPINIVMNLLLRILITSISAVVAAYILPGVDLADFSTAIIVAVVLALLNAILKPILVILTIPITIFTFGLFLLVINAGMIMLTSHFINGFEVNGFWYALLFSIVLSVISSLLGIENTRRRPEGN